MAISTDIFDGVNLAQLPAPQLVEPLDFDTVKDAIITDFIALFPEYSALSPADPVIKEIELLAYRELLLRQRVNEAGVARLLAFATGADLDHLAASVDLYRKEIVLANPSLGIAAVMESDDELRARVQRAPEGYSVAGPTGAYLAKALEADDDVRFASLVSPNPMEIVITIQSYSNGGIASPALVAKVLSYLSPDDVRPLGDFLTVQAATPVDYSLDAPLFLYDGPDAARVIATAQQNWLVYRTANERLGNDITVSAVHAAIHVPGVQRVGGNFATIPIGPNEFARCTDSNITFGGRDA
jgi:phage-related baseplate assembly protein